MENLEENTFTGFYEVDEAGNKTLRWWRNDKELKKFEKQIQELWDQQDKNLLWTPLLKLTGTKQDIKNSIHVKYSYEK